MTHVCLRAAVLISILPHSLRWLGDTFLINLIAVNKLLTSVPLKEGICRHITDSAVGCVKPSVITEQTDTRRENPRVKPAPLVCIIINLRGDLTAVDFNDSHSSH